MKPKLEPMIRLRRTGSADVTFRGAKLAHVRPDAADLQRWHELSLYRMAHGYVLAVAYYTNWKGELGRDDVYVLPPDPAAVVAALARHIPTRGVQGYPPGEQLKEKQARLMLDLNVRYEAQASELLRQADFTVDACELLAKQQGD